MRMKRNVVREGRSDGAAMNLFRLTAALTLVLGILAATATRALADDCLADPGPKYRLVPGLESSGFPVCYLAPNDANKAAYTALQARHILEAYSQFLSPLRLTHPLVLVALNCQPNFNSDSPFYSPADRALHFCYEWYRDVLQAAPTATTPEGVTRENVITGMWAGTLLHETGHALFDMLDVPVFGREEDAADETAAFIALQFNKDVQRTIINGFAYFWQMEAKLGADPPTANDPNPPKDAIQRCLNDPLCAYSDEHGTASQRLYNTLCLGYGGDPDTFKDFVQKGWLPKARADDCAREYQQLKLAFSKTIMPFVDLDMMKKVQATQWLQPQELQ
jgi:Putative metallopeptidase